MIALDTQMRVGHQARASAARAICVYGASASKMWMLAMNQATLDTGATTTTTAKSTQEEREDEEEEEREGVKL